MHYYQGLIAYFIEDDTATNTILHTSHAFRMQGLEPAIKLACLPKKYTQSNEFKRIRQHQDALLGNDFPIDLSIMYTRVHLESITKIKQPKHHRNGMLKNSSELKPDSFRLYIPVVTKSQTLTEQIIHDFTYLFHELYQDKLTAIFTTNTLRDDQPSSLIRMIDRSGVINK